MPIESSKVKRWLTSVAPEIPITQLAKLAEVSRITLHQQLRRGHVPESSVIAICRALSLPPINVLGEFSEYSDLVASGPAMEETLAFVDWPELIQAVGRTYRGELVLEADLGKHSFDDISRVWVDAIDPGGLRTKVCEAEGLTSSNLAASMRGFLKVPLAVTFARLAGTPLSSAFVVAGALSPIEAGWRPNERAEALRQRPIPELLTLVESRVAAAYKQEKRAHAFTDGLA